MLKPINLSLNIIRNLGKNVYKWRGEGIKYPGFTYYPRKPDFEDPPCEPSKLFMVKRVKPVKGTPYWERNILKLMHLDGKSNEAVIVKNIPENNARLWRIKHLVEITPITFPSGLPTKDSVTYLKENGQLEIKHLEGVHQNIEALDKFKSDVKRLDGDTLRRKLRLKWLNAW